MGKKFQNGTVKLAVMISLILPATLLLRGQTFPADASSIQAMWEGDVTAPQWKEHVRLLLVQKGTNLSGWMWRSDPQEAVPEEVIGEVNSSLEFQIHTESGQAYLGRFADTSTMAGVRPNGNENDRGVPRFPFQLKRMRNAENADFPPPLPPTSTDWKAFFLSFTNAVQRHDRFALEKMMSRRFQLDYKHSPHAGDELNGLDAGFWSELSKAVSHGTGLIPGKKSPFVIEQRVAYTCTKCAEQGNVDFTKGRDGQWRWNGLFYAD